MPKSVVAGIAGAVRIQRLTRSQLSDAEDHGLRLDASSQSRKVREAEPLTTTGLDLATLRMQHIEGALVPKSDTVALHMLIQFPVDLVDGNDGQWMLKRAREFAQKTFGGDAVFADRIDRDETGMHTVDLFLAPRYLKKTKHAEKPAVSISKHLKNLAIATGRWDPTKGRDAPLLVQGQALQDAWFEYLRTECQLTGVARGSPKRTAGGDWMPAEVLDVERRQENAARAAAEALRAEEAAKQALRAVEQREAALRASERAAMLATGRAEAVRMGQAKTKAAQAAEQIRLDALAIDLAQRWEEIETMKIEWQAKIADVPAAIGRKLEQLEAEFRKLMAPLVDAVKRFQDGRSGLSPMQQQAAALKVKPAKDVIEGVDAETMREFLNNGRSR